MTVEIQGKEEKDFYTIGGGISVLYLISLLLVFPFYYHNGYYDILQAKFQYFWISSAVYSVVMGLFLLLYAFTLRKEIRKRIYSALLFQDEEGKRKLRFSSDIFFAALLLLYLISMLHSGYLYEGWWGNTGRFMGTLTWLLLFLDYFFLTRFYRFRKGHLLFLSASVFLQASWGISDFFFKNVMHFFDLVEDKSLWATFAGGVGNINGYCSLMVSYAGLFAGLYLGERKWQWRVLFLSLYFYTVIASIYGMSDNVVFALFTLFLALPFFCFKRKSLLLSVIDLYIVFFLAMKLAVFFIPKENSSYQLGDVGFFLKLGHTVLPYLAIVFFAFLRILVWKGKEEYGVKIYRPLYFVLFFCILGVVFFVFYDANVSHRMQALTAYADYFTFNDAWGSGRGFIWKLGFDFFARKMSFLERLIGYGPDSFYMITNDFYKAEVSRSAYEAIDNVHNEYLNVLLTLGVLGLLCYLLFLISAFRTLFSKTEEGEEEDFSRTVFPRACGFCLLCYVSQAIINIAVPIVLPIVFVLFFLGLGSKKARP